jgi:hypothetical protein
MPKAICAHNSYWMWGYGAEERGVVIVLGGSRAYLDDLFESVELATTFECALCMPYENHKPIWIARGMRRPWREVWPELRRYE